MRSVPAAPATILALSSRYRQRLRRRLIGVALTAQSLTWSCLGIIPVLLATHQWTWQRLAVFDGVYVGAMGISAIVTAVWPPQALQVRAVLGPLALASCGAWLVIASPSLVVQLPALLVMGALGGRIEAQAMTYAAWLKEDGASPRGAWWSWLVASAGCASMSAFAWAVGWRAPFFGAAWGMIISGALLLGVPDPPLPPALYRHPWRADVQTIWHGAQQLWPIRGHEGQQLWQGTAWLVVQLGLPAFLIVDRHAPFTLGWAMLVGLPLAMVAGMVLSGTLVAAFARKRPIAQIRAILLGVAACLLALVLVVSSVPSLMVLIACLAFLLGMARACSTQGIRVPANAMRANVMGHSATAVVASLILLGSAPLGDPLACLVVVMLLLGLFGVSGVMKLRAEMPPHTG
jgi:hypothetical protein